MRLRLLLLFAILGLALLGYASGLHVWLAPDRLRELVSAAGIWGPLLLVVLFSLLQPFFVPGALFLLAAATLWPFWPALAINLLGATGAGMTGFAFARTLGRDWVADRMTPRMRAWDDYLSAKGLRAVLLFRLLFFLNPASHWALGLSGVRASTATLGTAVGFLPLVALWTYFGAAILDWFAGRSVWNWLVGGVAIVGVVLVVRRIRRRRVPVPVEPPEARPSNA
jgi:uncharacterized membrane protein YdjX (TVP38/TMEM64 family)